MKAAVRAQAERCFSSASLNLATKAALPGDVVRVLLCQLLYELQRPLVEGLRFLGFSLAQHDRAEAVAAVRQAPLPASVARITVSHVLGVAKIVLEVGAAGLLPQQVVQQGDGLRVRLRSPGQMTQFQKDLTEVSPADRLVALRLRCMRTRFSKEGRYHHRGLILCKRVRQAVVAERQLAPSMVGDHPQHSPAPTRRLGHPSDCGRMYTSNDLAASAALD